MSQGFVNDTSITLPLVVSQGGSGRASTTPYAVICGGTTGTGAEQSISSVGTAGQVFTSNGAGALPGFSDPTAAATQAEQETGTSTVTYVSPGRQQFHPSAAKVWCYFTTIAATSILSSYNVTSLTDNGTGNTRVNFTTSFSTANFSTIGILTSIGTAGTTGSLTVTSQNSGNVTLLVHDTNSTAAFDCIQSMCSLGDQ